MKATSDVKILKGQIWIYRAFDIAEEIDLQAVERLLTQRAETAVDAPGGAPGTVPRSRLSIARSPKQAVVMRNAPVRLRMALARIEGLADPFEVFVTVFDYGVLSFCFQLPMPAGASWSEWVKRAEELGPDTELGERLQTVARQRSTELMGILNPALKAPAERAIFEDYVIHFIEKVEGIEDGQQLLATADIAALILAEPREPLSQKTRDEIQGGTFQYGTGDLAVIDWNSALILEPTGNRDTADVLEFAVTHLLEFRYYDAVLDERLSGLYDTIERLRAKPVPLKMILKEDFAEISREANTRYLEFSEFIERIDNSLKVMGDSYLAVIFRAAVRRFRLPDWKESVSRKLGILAQVSALLQGEINVYRGHTLEIIIIALIAFEVVSAIVRTL